MTWYIICTAVLLYCHHKNYYGAIKWLSRSRENYMDYISSKILTSVIKVGINWPYAYTYL